MPDIVSLAWIASLIFGLVIGDAAVFGDPTFVQISVPSKLSDAGFTQSTAEQVFEAEVVDIGQALSIVPTPTVQLRAPPTIGAAITKPLNLGKLVSAVQTQLGLNVTTITGGLIADDKSPQLGMVMVVFTSHERPTQINLTQDDGNATVLVQRSAHSALEWVATYRLALAQLIKGLQGDKAALEQAKGTATRGLARPWVPSRASERVMLFNLLALLAIENGDTATAEANFRLSDTVPEAGPAPHGIVALNRAFLAIAAKHPEEAERWFKQGQEQTTDIDLPEWNIRIIMLHALIAWSHGDLVSAEHLLRQAVAEQPQDESPHAYLAQLLAAKGDAAGAAMERNAAASRRQYVVQIPDLATSDFWIDMATGDLKQRG